MKLLFERLHEATARLDVVISIAGALGDGFALAEPLKDLLGEDEETMELCFGALSDELLDALNTREDLDNTFFQWATQTAHLGFAVKIATPVMTPVGEHSVVFSWGYYRTRWVYGDTFEDAVEKGLAWVKEFRPDD